MWLKAFGQFCLLRAGNILQEKQLLKQKRDSQVCLILFDSMPIPEFRLTCRDSDVVF